MAEYKKSACHASTSGSTVSSDSEEESPENTSIKEKRRLYDRQSSSRKGVKPAYIDSIESQCPSWQSEFQVNSDYIEKIIEEDDSELQKIQEKCSVIIDIERGCDADGYTLVTLTGMPENREKAKRKIEKLINEFHLLPKDAEITQNVECEEYDLDAAIDEDALYMEFEKAKKKKFGKMPEIQKDLYQEDSTVASMSKEQVNIFREVNNVSVSKINKHDDPQIQNPVHTIEQAFRNFPQFVKELRCKGFKDPSPIHCQSWPIILSGHDMITISNPGIDRISAFLFPALIHVAAQVTPREKRRSPSVVIIAPTQESAQIIKGESDKYSYQNITSVCVHGSKQQIDGSKTDIIIATPGKLHNLLLNKCVDITETSYLVIDEVDYLLDQGYEPLTRLINLEIRVDCQTVLTSTAWTYKVQDMASKYLIKPIKVNAGAPDYATMHSITQEIICAKEEDKSDLLVYFLTNITPENKVLVFVDSKRNADDLKNYLYHRGFVCHTISGNIKQHLKKGSADINHIQILIATDVASWGLDFKYFTHLFHLHFPDNIEEYVHRVGRLGSGGHVGKSVSVVTQGNWQQSENLVKVLEDCNQFVPNELYCMSRKCRAYRQREEEIKSSKLRQLLK